MKKHVRFVERKSNGNQRKRRVSVLLAGILAALSAAPSFADPGAVLAGGLNELVVGYENGNPHLAQHLKLHVTDQSGNVLVRVRLAPTTTVDAALPALQAAGFRLTTRSSINKSLIEGFVPLAQARSLAGVAGVVSLHATQLPVKNAGSVQSQAVALERADIAQAHGWDGTGIRIGALSDSYDTCATCSTHAADDIASGDLPAAGVTVLADYPGGTDEGRAMLQLMHDIAPGATLGFATADQGELQFAENIIALRSQFHADVIVDDVFYFDEPMYSDGIIAQAVDLAYQAGAAYFSSAGNNGQEAYEALYKPVTFEQEQKLLARGKTNIHLEQIPLAIRPQSVHNFGGGEEGDDGAPSISQRFSSGYTNFVGFQWDEPFFLGLVKTDFNIYVFDKDGNWQDPNSPQFAGFYTTDDNTQTDAAFEYAYLPNVPGDLEGDTNVSEYQIVIGNVNNGPATHIKYITLNGLGISQRQGAPSVSGHTAARGARSIAAAYYAIPKTPEDFSSPGPVTILFDTNGNRLAQPEVRYVPQLTGADGVDTTFFGYDADGNGLPNFFGTSAAAPDVAAVAALTLQSAGGPGSLSPKHVYERLEHTAKPISVAEDRSFAHAEAGPVTFSMKGGDWTRWERYFQLSVAPWAKHSVKSITFDTTAANLNWSGNPTRFHIGVSNGVALSDITRTPAGHLYTLGFAPGKFAPGGAFKFGMSVFNPLQGSTEEVPDRFRGTTVTVTMDNGDTYTGKVQADDKEAFNRYTGYGLVDAAKATSSN